MCTVNTVTLTQAITDIVLQIVEVEQPFDRVKNQRRAFIFITYESEEVVEQAVANSKQIVGGKEVRANSWCDMWKALLRFFSIRFASEILLFQQSVSADFITTVWSSRLISYSKYRSVRCISWWRHWLLRIAVMALCTYCRRNISVWICCSRLSSHTYEIVTECCGSLDASSRPDRRKVTVTGHVTRWLNRL